MPRKRARTKQLADCMRERHAGEREKFQWQQRQHDHKPSMTLTGTDKLQNLINHYHCPKCNQKGTQLVNQRSLKGVITNLEIVCSCGSKITSYLLMNLGENPSFVRENPSF